MRRQRPRSKSKVQEVDIADPVGREVLIDVKASGPCHADLGVATFIERYTFPAVLGHELTRAVSAVAPVTNQKHVHGVYMGSSNLKRDIPLYASLYLQGRMNLDRLVSREISRHRIDEGYESLKDGNTARVVITDLT
jgi:Zn-dependent alcohol dehydrogenase